MKEGFEPARLRKIVQAWEKLGMHSLDQVVEETGIPLEVVRQVYEMLGLIRARGLFPIKVEGVEQMYFVRKVDFRAPMKTE